MVLEDAHHDRVPLVLVLVLVATVHLFLRHWQDVLVFAKLGIKADQLEHQPRHCGHEVKAHRLARRLAISKATEAPREAHAAGRDLQHVQIQRHFVGGVREAQPVGHV